MKVSVAETYRRVDLIFSWERDIAFFREQSGYKHSIGRKHRNAKRKIAYEWLRELQVEFDKVYDEGIWLLVQSDRERPDLQRALHRAKFTFYKRMIILRLRLFLGAPAVVDTRKLCAALETLSNYSWIVQGEVQVT